MWQYRRQRAAWPLAAFLLLLTVLLTQRVQAADMTFHPYYYQGVMKKSVTAKAEDGSSRSFSKGSRVTVKKRTSGKNFTVLKRGKEYEIPKSKINLTGLITDGEHPYSARQAEKIANQKEWSSPTKYLIWISTFKQHMYIFKGSRGKWKCIHDWACSTGRFGTEFETDQCKTKIGAKYDWFNFSYYYRAKWASTIRGGAIHSWTYNEKQQRRKGKPGKPRSRGCVRVETENAKWIYDTIPVKTTVQIR